jgi:hypothetical protein
VFPGTSHQSPGVKQAGSRRELCLRTTLDPACDACKERRTQQSTTGPSCLNTMLQCSTGWTTSTEFQLELHSRGGRCPPAPQTRNSSRGNRLVWIVSHARLGGLIGCDCLPQDETLAPTASCHTYSAHQLAQNINLEPNQVLLPTSTVLRSRDAYSGLEQRAQIS